MTPAFAFVPVETDAASMGEPGWHDGSQSGRLSGEIRCTLKAVTPLLVGCHRFELTDAETSVQNAFRELVSNRAQVPANAVSLDDRTLLQPLMAPSATGVGAVLIPGSSLKGMLRNAIGSLLAAPIERINERRFTQRPNLEVADGYRRRIVPAVVTGLSEKGAITGIRCVPYQSLQYRWDDSAYIDNQASAKWHQITQLPPNARQGAYTQNIPASEISLGDNNQRWVLVRSHRGLDHEGELDREFIRQNPNDGNRRPLPEFVGIKLTNDGHWPVAESVYPSALPPNVFKAYCKTQETLADAKFGHLRDHPLVHQAGIDSVRLNQIKNRIKNPQFAVGDLVFLEMAVTLNGRVVTGGRIVAMGHHLRYRWGATDSVQRTSILGQSPTLRKEIKPKNDEISNLAPQKLSGARLLFGYTAPGKDYAKPEWPTSHGIGFNSQTQKETDCSKLAGRIAINHALEIISANRFLNTGNSCLVPLRPQGSPKPSFARDYANQNPGNNSGITGASSLRTWGDALDSVGAPLAGRKHYWHQNNPRFELQNPQSPDWMIGNNKAILSKFSQVARFVSQPGTNFRFTLRFTDLMPYELGALLFALSPTDTSALSIAAKFSARINGITNIPLKNRLLTCDLVNPHNNWNNAVFGHKLGHGRPLGMGSVTIAIDSVRTAAQGQPVPSELSDAELQAQRGAWEDSFLNWLGACREDHLEKQMSVIHQWLDLHRIDGKGFRLPRDLDECMQIWKQHSRDRKG